MSAQMIEPEIIDVVIDENGTHALGRSISHRHIKFKIQEIMLGYGNNRKAIPWTKNFLYYKTECRAEILENGKLRIV